MLNTIIIEDERPAIELLSKILSDLKPEVNVVATLNTVAESLQYFLTNHHIDLIFSDVQLPDGLSFQIFAENDFNIPVIFVTAYDEYLVRAFENNTIDYILKPFNKSDVEKAILKYNNLKEHFAKDKLMVISKSLFEAFDKRKKKRLLLKWGIENISILLDDICLINTQDKMVYVVDRFSKKYVCDKTLSQLEEELDENIFFRANRQCIINVNFIKSFKTIERVKIQVNISSTEMKETVIISQETSPLFKKWIQQT